MRLALYLFEHMNWCLSLATPPNVFFVADIHLQAPSLNSHSSSQNDDFARTSAQLKALNKAKVCWAAVYSIFPVTFVLYVVVLYN